jgi:hypothetical protein
MHVGTQFGVLLLQLDSYVNVVSAMIVRGMVSGGEAGRQRGWNSWCEGANFPQKRSSSTLVSCQGAAHERWGDSILETGTLIIAVLDSLCAWTLDTGHPGTTLDSRSSNNPRK